MASIVSSGVTALALTPFDMVFFKLIAKTSTLQKDANFMDVSRSVYSSRPAAATALGVAMTSTFVRYFFFYTGVNLFYNTKMM